MIRFRLGLGLVLVLMPACLTESPIAAKQELSADEQLRASIGPFCDDTCSRNIACHWDTADDCPAGCRDNMAAYVGHGDDCVQLGQGIEDCVARLKTCDALATLQSCDVSTDAHDACSATGPDGAPTSDETDQPSVGPPVGCESQETGRGPEAPSGHPTATSCELSAAQCSDGAEYRVSCNLLQTTGTMLCNCYKDEVATDVPSWRPATDCPTTAEVNEECSWNVVW